jgi:CheY-like chemotaxis protein
MSGKPLLLLIEDNEDFQNLYGLVAEEAGYELEQIFSGLSALARLDQEPLPAIVLLDSRLPGASGMEILQAARSKERWSHVPIYMMTADLRGAREFREIPPDAPHPDGVFEKGGSSIREIRELFKKLLRSG